MLYSFIKPGVAFAAALGLFASTANAETLRFAHVDPDDWQNSKKGAAAHVFKNIVEGESDLTVEIFPAGALGNEDELVSQAQDMVTQVVMVSGAMSKLCKAAAVLDIPYTFPSAPVAWEVLDGPFGQELAEHCLKKTGLRTLAYGETGFRNFTNNSREIRTPGDMAGLKFRVQPIPLDEWFQTLKPADQEVIKKAAKVAATMGRAIQQWNTASGVTKVQAEGMKVYSPTAEELAMFREKAQPVVKRIIVHGRVLDENARPVANTLIEVWQANAGGRYRHRNDSYIAPIDPNFGGCGRTLSDEDGYYFFRTVKPGAYPWRNSVNNWRPAHIHISVFGTSFSQRLVTQLYFEGDPLIPLCPIVQTIPDGDAIEQLIARLDMNGTVPLDTIAYKFDIVLRGRRSTLFENRLEGN